MNRWYQSYIDDWKQQQSIDRKERKLKNWAMVSSEREVHKLAKELSVEVRGK